MAVSKKSSNPRVSPHLPLRRKVKLPYNRAIQVPFKRKKVSSPRSESLQKRARSDNRILSLLTKAFFVLGFLLLAVYIVLRINQEVQLAYVTPHVTQQPLDASKEAKPLPTNISISKVSIDIPIQQAAITNNVWEIAQDGASHLNISARPGEEGAIIMYGHNTNDRFGPIRWLNNGDRIDISTADGFKHTYTISQTMRVKPDKMDVFTKHKGEVLILYTCDGFADLERFVVIAKPL